MASFSLGAMDLEEAKFLCECLLLDDFEIKEDENKDTLIHQICELSEKLPFIL